MRGARVVPAGNESVGLSYSTTSNNVDEIEGAADG